MIPKECKRLAEVDFPIAVVSKHSAREKSGPQGHPNMLHLWWARRPLSACRAMLLGLLLPDPLDPHCPEHFKKEARTLLPAVVGLIRPNGDALRHALLKFIGEFSNWNRSIDRTYIAITHGLIKAAYGEEPPLVVDPFAGGGSIPLEALRIGCESFATDLNPVACLILKVMLEEIPRHGHQLADNVRRVGKEIKVTAEQELSQFYPTDPDGARPIAYLWARTVRCETSGCDAEIPIFRSAWLSKKGSNKARYFKESSDGKSVVLLIDKAPRGGPITFRIARGFGTENSRPGYIQLHGTKAAGNNANVVCPCCHTVLPGSKTSPRVPTQLKSQRGGADVVFDRSGKRIGGSRLLAVVTVRPGEKGKQYRLQMDNDYDVLWKAEKALQKLVETPLPNGLSPIPNEPLPPIGTLGFRVQRYGILNWGDLFTVRQKLALATLNRTIQESKAEGGLATSLACAFDRVAMSAMTCTRWNPSAEKMQHTFGRQALPIVWDFAEVVPTAEAPGNWQSGYELVAEVIEPWPGSLPGQVELADACDSPLLDFSASVWFTDPPYYDAIPYSDLSDFFFVWLKRTLPGHSLLRDPFDSENPLTPKSREAVQDETKEIDGHPKDRDFFEKAMAKAFAEGRRVLRDDGIGCVVFAHKTTEGWEALLSGMVKGGWVITGSWPIATEMGSRLRARDSAALSTSVHLVCRPRITDEIGDWGEVYRDLPVRVGDWIERLQSEGVRGADLVFACIGPAMEIYSKYSKVEDAEGREIPLGGDATSSEPYKRGFLAYVWETVGRLALQQVLGTAEARARNGAAGAIEEDARLTALFLWTLQSTNGQDEDETKVDTESDEDEASDGEEEGGSTHKKTGYALIYDVARRFAQPLGIHLDQWEGRIIQTEKGIVRLLPVSERADQLFGPDGASAVATRIEQEARRNPQLTLEFVLPELEPPVIKVRGKKKTGKGASLKQVSDEALTTQRQATTLDRVHAAMLLQSSGRANALRTLLKGEQERGPDFLRLANALSALYPKESEEKRLLDAMLLAVPR